MTQDNISYDNYVLYFLTNLTHFPKSRVSITNLTFWNFSKVTSIASH